jgi:hypothetical protein
VHPGLFPTYLLTYPPIFTKARTMDVDEGIAIYQVGCFILLFTDLPTRPYNFSTIENKVAMTN